MSTAQWHKPTQRVRKSAVICLVLTLVAAAVGLSGCGPKKATDTSSNGHHPAVTASPGTSSSEGSFGSAIRSTDPTSGLFTSLPDASSADSSDSTGSSSADAAHSSPSTDSHSAGAAAATEKEDCH
ncbi:hypothetical protein [Gorillibacterium timonense]|uniref:hypothetical protein n=1 Tax=Gorillibacterium timonense TaxID=1689269 RepID=UPI0011DE4BDE|nr:hypothetical protein [Gorillibacterium timonense]